ncbi:MAG: hypothetical protein ABEJ75_03105 [Candidatus Nanohaloarchaea archaeon]
MTEETDYLEYAVVLSLSMIAVSASYLVQASNYTSWVFLALVPVSYGYTAYISRVSFQKAALTSLLVLAFIPLGKKMAAVAVVTALGNIFVSVFAGGERFRDYYSSTRIPLLLIGILVAGVTFYAATSNPAVAETIRTVTGNAIGAQSQQIVEQSNILSAQKKAQVTLVKEASRATVTATQAYVLNRSRDDLSVEGLSAVNNAFQKARAEIPARISDRMRERLDSYDINMSARVSDLVQAQLTGKRFLILVPFIILTFTALQPVVGLITALSAFLFSYIDESVA